ncbi:MAG TPA: HAD family hydrolase, partial [Stellaceae bacterium]|nr:HAD family hydrolase [Stellaceae bacterium]
MSERDTVIFDLGGVLLDWSPRHLYRRLFAGDEAAMEDFLATVCNSEWNRQQDAGRAVAEACALLKDVHPGKDALIEAYYGRHLDMIAGPIAGSVAILRELRERGVKLYFLSNYSAETY